MRRCYNCQKEVDEKLGIFRSTLCPVCGRDLKVCKNCRFYSPGSHWDCRESVDELVKDKERSNFCAFFSFQSGETTTGTANAANSDLQALWGKENPTSKPSAKNGLKKIFNDE